MKAITIHQPWATLIAIGAKNLETRNWLTSYRGRLAIHAGKKIDREACEQEPIKSILAKHGYTPEGLPIGAIVASFELKDCWQVIGVADVPLPRTRVLSSDNRMFGITEGSNEFRFGDYSIGRYVWELTEVQKLIEPILATGRQGLWNWEEDSHE